MHHLHTAYEPHWNLIIPVKDIRAAKTRLSRFDQPTRAALALAFALDAASAASSCPWIHRVVVVTNDQTAVAELAHLGVDFVAEGPDAGQNGALLHAASLIRRDSPDASLVAMSSDLPAVRAIDLSTAFERTVATPRWFVSDTESEGTTMLAAAAGADFLPRFGPDSRRRHRGDGAIEVPADGLERLRRDVDTEEHLTDAIGWGVGRHSQSALARLRIACGA